MFSLRFLLRQLSPFVVRATLAPGRDLCPAQTELLYDQKLLLADHLYLGDLSSSSEVLARGLSHWRRGRPASAGAAGRLYPGTLCLLHA